MMPFHLLNNQCDILIFLNLSLGWMHPRVVFTSSIMTAFCIQDSIGYFSQRGTLLVGVAGLGNTDSFVCMEKNDQTMAILQLIFVNTPNPQYRMPLCRRSQIGCMLALESQYDTKQLLCISSSERVLHTPFAGGNQFFWCKTIFSVLFNTFYDKKDVKICFSIKKMIWTSK